MCMCCAVIIEHGALSAQITNLQSELSHVTLDWEHVTVQLSHMTSLVDSESVFLNSTTEVVVSDIVALSTEDGQVRERAALTQSINNKRRSQIQVGVCVWVCVLKVTLSIRRKKGVCLHYWLNWKC